MPVSRGGYIAITQNAPERLENTSHILYENNPSNYCCAI